MSDTVSVKMIKTRSGMPQLTLSLSTKMKVSGASTMEMRASHMSRLLNSFPFRYLLKSYVPIRRQAKPNTVSIE
jgi:hypothetical protein